VKLALVSDLHANLEALDAVLADIERARPRPQLVCAGDIVGYGPDPEACIARLKERGALCVMGNHEEMVLGRRDFSHCPYAGIVAAMWTRSRLSASALDFIARLPFWREAAPGVIVCHGDLASADTYVSTPERAEHALAQLREQHASAEVLVCGHTHHAALFTCEQGFRLIRTAADYDLAPGHAVLINPGAVGQARSAAPHARYAVLDSERGHVSFREVAYDHRATLRKLRAAKLVAQVVLEPPQGVLRRVEKYKARWARYWAERGQS
jgi:predicted phosphodiesterase